MNIFVLHINPRTAAQHHADKHVGKMLIESAQMLSTAHHIVSPLTTPADAYKPTHANHPCSIWARTDAKNYLWLYELADALAEEYEKRYGKTHATAYVLECLSEPPVGLPSKTLTPFAQAMPDQYKHKDAVMAYRAFYMHEKRSFATWKTQPPYWWP